MRLYQRCQNPAAQVRFMHLLHHFVQAGDLLTNTIGIASTSVLINHFSTRRLADASMPALSVGRRYYGSEVRVMRAADVSSIYCHVRQPE